MEEQFILRVPPSVAERLDRLLSENPTHPDDDNLDLSFQEDGRNGTFMIGKDKLKVTLMDLPCVVESYKTYDDNVLIKTADIGQIIMVREDGELTPEGTECRHGLTPPMRDARRRRFRREPDLNPELVQQVENDLLNIMAGGTAHNVDVEVVEQEEDADEDDEHAQPPPQATTTTVDQAAADATVAQDETDSDEYD